MFFWGVGGRGVVEVLQQRNISCNSLFHAFKSVHVSKSFENLHVLSGCSRGIELPTKPLIFFDSIVEGLVSSNP